MFIKFVHVNGRVKSTHIFLNPDEAEHIWGYLEKKKFDRTSAQDFCQSRHCEKIKKDSFFSEREEEYAHVNERAVCETVAGLIKDFDEEATEVLMFPALWSGWYETEHIMEPAVVSLAKLESFVRKECILFVNDYFITSKRLDWWIIISSDETIYTWKVDWG